MTPELPEDTHRLDDADWWTVVQQRLDAMHDDGTFRRNPSLKVDDIVSEWRKERLTALEENPMTEYAAPDPYQKALEQLRATVSAPAVSFEEQDKQRRLAQLKNEYRQHEDALIEKPSPRFTQSAEFAAPDPYAAGLKALKEQP